MRTSISEFRKACCGLPYFVKVEKPPPSSTECAGHNDIRQTELLTAEQLVCEPSILMIEFRIENLGR